MKRAIIIHCWEGYPEYCWYQRTKKELEAKGFKVDVPLMPNTDNPQLSEWLPHLKKIIGKPDENLYLIGHSLGNPTIFRYLETLRYTETIGGAVLVAGYSDDLGFKELSNFFRTPINFKNIKKHCKKFVAIHSDNDPYVSLSYGEEIKNKLGAELIIKHNMGHFSGAIESEKSCTSLPDVAKSLFKISKNSVFKPLKKIKA